MNNAVLEIYYNDGGRLLQAARTAYNIMHNAQRKPHINLTKLAAELTWVKMSFLVCIEWEPNRRWRQNIGDV